MKWANRAGRVAETLGAPDASLVALMVEPRQGLGGAGYLAHDPEPRQHLEPEQGERHVLHPSLRIGAQRVPQDLELRLEEPLAGVNQVRPLRRGPGKVGRETLEEPGALTLQRRQKRQHQHRKHGGRRRRGIQDGLARRAPEGLFGQVAAQELRDVAQDAVSRAPQSGILHVARARQRGGAAVELAIFLPLLFFLAFGAITTVRVLRDYSELNQLSQTGARYATRAALDPTRPTEYRFRPTSEEVEAYVTEVAELTVTSIDVTPDPSTAYPGDEVTVTVRSRTDLGVLGWLANTMAGLVGGGDPFPEGGLDMASTASMREE